MAIKKIKVGGTSYDINDPRITGVDTTPTSSSGNVITSGGVYTALQNAGEDRFFVATYGVTTGDELGAAITAGKIPICFYQQTGGTKDLYVCMSDYHGDDAYRFLSFVEDTWVVKVISVLEGSSPSWGTPYQYSLQGTDYRVTSISSSSDNYHYPTAKAVYDAVAAKYTKPSSGIPAADIASGVIPDAVTANPTVPQGTTPTTLTGLKIGNNYYGVSSGSGSGSTADCVHITGDETIAGDKTFSDTITLVDPSCIIFAPAEEEEPEPTGFTKGTKSTTLSTAAQSITFTNLSGEPKAFIVAPSGSITQSGNTVVGCIGDSSINVGVYNTGSQSNYSNAFSHSYSGTTLTVTAPTGDTFGVGTYDLIYYYGSGTLSFRNTSIQPGSGITSVTFTDSAITAMPALFGVVLETSVASATYRRVEYVGYDGTTKYARTFYNNNPIADTSSNFTISYNNGVSINSGGQNNGGYFHNPGTYTIYYLTSSDVGTGGSGSSSEPVEPYTLQDLLGSIETLLAAI